VLFQIDRFVRAIPSLYIAWALPLILALVLLVPPWQQPDEPEHFLRIAQVADGGLLGYRWGTTAGGRSDPAIVAALLPFNSIPRNRDLKVTAEMHASANRFHWSATRENTPFPHTAIYPPFLYAPGALAVWVGRALDLTIIQTLYLARSANAITSALLTLAALTLSRRARCALAVIAALPMVLSLYASASKDALTISLVLLAVGAIDRIVDEQRAATSSETLLISLALLFPAVTRPPYVILSGLLLLTARSKPSQAVLAGSAIIACTVLWWFYAAAASLVELPPYDASAQMAFLMASPMGAVGIFWQTLVNQWSVIAEELIGILGWLDTRLPRSFVEMAAAVLVLGMLSATAGPAYKPWLAMALITIGTLSVYIAIYLTFTSPEAPFVRTLQGRLFLPLAAVLPLALPQLPWLGTRILPLAVGGIVILALADPVVIVRALVVRYYLTAG
jgi:uncharacterized membrane protein